MTAFSTACPSAVSASCFRRFNVTAEISSGVKPSPTSTALGAGRRTGRGEKCPLTPALSHTRWSCVPEAVRVGRVRERGKDAVGVSCAFRERVKKKLGRSLALPEYREREKSRSHDRNRVGR
jgi:hypothetical protein